MAWICFTCGTQYAPSDRPPAGCAICLDERQFVGWEGQRWTCLETLASIYRNVWEEQENGLWSIHTEPHFAIGQRAFLLKTREGNILWDCVALLDEASKQRIAELGGLAAIAISHPHYYTTMVEWSRAFGNVPVYVHEKDSEWVMRPDSCVRFWGGKTQDLPGGAKLVLTGGHFEGFQVLHWPEGAGGKGVLLAGDQPQVCSDRKWVSFLYSYPNYIPLGPRAVRGIVDALAPLEFDRLYGAFPGKTVMADAKGVVERSAERYVTALGCA